MLVNDYQHGHALDENCLRLHLIRSSYAPDPLPEIGEHEMQLRLGPTLGPATPAEANRRAAAQHHPLVPTGTDAHKGELPDTAAFLTVAGDGIELSGLKRAETGDGLIVRVYETAGNESEACVTLNRPLLGRVTAACETDILERPAANDSGRVRVEAENRVIASVPAFGIVTLKIQTDKREG